MEYLQLRINSAFSERAWSLVESYKPTNSDYWWAHTIEHYTWNNQNVWLTYLVDPQEKANKTVWAVGSTSNEPSDIDEIQERLVLGKGWEKELVSFIERSISLIQG